MNQNAKERALCGALMVDDDGSALSACREIGLNASHFSDMGAGLVYECILETAGRGRPVNCFEIADALKKRGVLDRIGGPTATDRMVDVSLHSFEVEATAIDIYRAALGRLGAKTCTDYADRLAKTDEPERTLAELQTAVSDIQVKGKAVKIHSVSQLMPAKIEAWRTARGKGYVGIPCPIAPEINDALGGMRPGVMTVLGAYRGTGKSTLARQWGLGVAQMGYKTLLCTLEDPSDIAAAGIVGNYANRSVFWLDTGKASEDDIDLMHRSAQELSTLPLWIAGGGMTMTDIETAVALHRARHGVDFLIIDHIQFIMPYKLPGMDRNGTVATYSQRIVSLLHRLKIPGLVLSQLSRDSEKESRKPRLSDLRDSGCIEQDARQVLLMYWDGENAPKDETGKREYTHILELAKNNYGVSGVAWRVLREDGRQRFRYHSEVKK